MPLVGMGSMLKKEFASFQNFLARIGLYAFREFPKKPKFNV
jgi:hypothetical protein